MNYLDRNELGYETSQETRPLGTTMTFNLETEKRDGYLVSSEMKKVWQIEMQLLKQLLKVCADNNLRCWVTWGSLLGAVRHKGFIPWDDDIDLCMPRPDYDKLISIAKDAFKEPYFLQSAYTDTDYYAGHAQLRHSETCAIRPSACFNPFNQGIFIDIFVLDGVPEDEHKRKEVCRLTRKTQRFLKAKNTNIIYSGRLGLVFRKLYCKYLVKKQGWTAIYAEAEKMLRETPFETSKKVAEISFSGLGFVYDRDIFNDTVWLDFEDMQVPAPADYYKLLKAQFGENYMIPKRIATCHGDVVFSTERSYKEVLPEVRKEYKKSLINRILKKR